MTELMVLIRADDKHDPADLAMWLQRAAIMFASKGAWATSLLSARDADFNEHPSAVMALRVAKLQSMVRVIEEKERAQKEEA